MKILCKFTLITLLSILLALSACKRKGSEWKGTISEENGTIVVKNPREPIYEKPLFTVEEELVIGETIEGEEPVFLQVRGMAIDEEENIYVLDLKAAHIKVFDKQGDYIRTIGEKGEGPGELGMPWRIRLALQDELFVEDLMNRRITVYSLNGGFLRTISFAKINIGNIEINSTGNIYANTIVQDPENPRYEIQKFDMDLNFLHALDSSPTPELGIIKLFFSIIHFDVNEVDEVIVGYPEEYNIKTFNSEGELIRRIEKEYTPVKVPEEEIEKRKKEMPKDRKVISPEYHSAYRVFRCGEDGKIYVGTWEKTGDGKGFFYDVFDKEGKYINKLPLTIRPWIWKKGKIYTVEDDEDGYHLVKRYKVKWNNH